MTFSPRPLSLWTGLVEVTVVFCLLMVYIWGIQRFSVAFTLSLLTLALTSNAVRGEGCRHIGFSLQGFSKSLRALAPAVIGIAALLLAGGVVWHTVRNVPLRTAVVGFFLYCAWGLFQQYMLHGFFLNRLLEMSGGGITSTWPLLVVAAVFSAVHAPNWFLMAVTLPAGYLSALAFLRHRNLPVLALAHALLGCLIYLVVPDSISHGLYVGPNWWASYRLAH